MQKFVSEPCPMEVKVTKAQNYVSRLKLSENTELSFFGFSGKIYRTIMVPLFAKDHYGPFFANMMQIFM